MNSTLVFVLMLVAIVMIGQVVQTWLKQRVSKPEADEELVRTLERLDLLEESIQVLERIITENRFDLKKEIDSL